jgi:hypothetical protein
LGYTIKDCWQVTDKMLVLYLSSLSDPGDSKLVYTVQDIFVKSYDLPGIKNSADCGLNYSHLDSIEKEEFMVFF